MKILLNHKLNPSSAKNFPQKFPRQKMKKHCSYTRRVIKIIIQTIQINTHPSEIIIRNEV